eukprot:CAMPEP_0194067658 /NCGR_PEP_ID=MMETSP0009_2-20130614/86674_1 /TAXON_ID=210454 /ORGANISM="Grammatophora oceanica, Strain CCMP 410" /LENGTH=31 /DNA_ID= /DNA_START= /DNA_END= /DNA_ORIENTATION=
MSGDPSDFADESCANAVSELDECDTSEEAVT